MFVVFTLKNKYLFYLNFMFFVCFLGLMFKMVS